jgi:PhzF family phenazine biosynthesis protein
MAEVRYLQLDVFAARPGGGNPLAVVIGAGDWSGADMQRFAAWTNLVETTFLLEPHEPRASYRLRIFTPTREIPFAGHPTIGSAHAALDAGLVRAPDGRLLQECAAGLLPILVEGQGAQRRLLVQAPSARVLRRGVDADPQLTAILGDRRLGALPPAFVEGGRRWWLAELADEAQVRGWHPNHAAIAALAHASDSLGLCVFARSTAADHELVVRAFPAGVGIVEDPASGAANGLVAAYLADSEPAGPLGRGYRVSQGREIGHDASILIRIDGAAVWVGGQTQTVIDGRASWPLA